jgi:hypothetical protein
VKEGSVIEFSYVITSDFLYTSGAGFFNAAIPHYGANIRLCFLNISNTEINKGIFAFDVNKTNP